MKFLKNEKGFTLVEILVVIAIIAILFITLLPQIDRAVDRARQTGVKTDFRSFQLATETYLRETNGKSITLDGLQSNMDIGLHALPAEPTAPSYAGVGFASIEEDAWGSHYDILLYPTNKMIVVKSYGANEKDDSASAKSDDFILASYVVDGTVASCTLGFGDNEITSNVLSAATLATGGAGATWKCGQPLKTGTTETPETY